MGFKKIGKSHLIYNKDIIPYYLITKTENDETEILDVDFSACGSGNGA